MRGGRETSHRAESKVFGGKVLVTRVETFFQFLLGCVHLLLGSTNLKVLNTTSGLMFRVRVRVRVSVRVRVRVRDQVRARFNEARSKGLSVVVNGAKRKELSVRANKAKSKVLQVRAHTELGFSGQGSI